MNSQVIEPSDLRIQVAKDVLAQIAAKKLVAESGIYLRIDNVVGEFDDQFNTAFAKSGTCTACAIGSLFVGLIDVENHCTVDEMQDEEHNFIDDGWASNRRLVDVFGEDSLNLIERAFEGWDAYDGKPSFRSRHKIGLSRIYDEKALIAIMNNIVENAGVFVP